MGKFSSIPIKKIYKNFGMYEVNEEYDEIPKLQICNLASKLELIEAKISELQKKFDQMQIKIMGEKRNDKKKEEKKKIKGRNKKEKKEGK